MHLRVCFSFILYSKKFHPYFTYILPQSARFFNKPTNYCLLTFCELYLLRTVKKALMRGGIPLTSAYILFYDLRLFLIGDKLDSKESSYRKNYTHGQTYPRILNKSRNNKHYEGYCRYGYSVRHLGGHVIQMVAASACGGHDGRIRNR